MSRLDRLSPVFVCTIPTQTDLVPGELYVSMKYGVVVHHCPCGCGQLSELTLAPERWHLSYDGEFLSLNPSIGNSRLHCRSHYWIRRNKVVWCRPMTPVTSALAQKREDQERESKYDASGHAFSRLKKFFTKCWSRFR